MEELPIDLIEAALLQFAEEELDWPEYGSYINYYDSKNRVWDVPNLGPVTIVDFHNYDLDKNYDGWSEQMWIVFDIQGKLYRAKGNYTSFSGSEWEPGLTIVEPKTKLVTYYEEA